MSTERMAPSADLVRAACAKFDNEYLIVEQALKELFSRYHGNDYHPHVLLKVVALNRLYSTQILAVHDVARHIHQQAQEIDSALTIGSPEIIDKIARVTLSIDGKKKNNYSFATKYCSWHNPALYPVFDLRVETYICSLRKQDPTLFDANANLRDYRTFLRVMTALRVRFGLEDFTFKEIDKFFWSEGRRPDLAGT